MLSWIAWIVLGAVAVAFLITVDNQLRDRRKRRHAYRMKRLDYDEQALGEADLDHQPTVLRCPECGIVTTQPPEPVVGPAHVLDTGAPDGAAWEADGDA